MLRNPMKRYIIYSWIRSSFKALLSSRTMNNPNDNLPEGISLEDQIGKRIITYQWYSNFYIPLFIFFLVWDGASLYDFIQAILHHSPNIWASLLCASPHILVGLFMTYYLVAIVVNQTIIEMENAELRLTHTPLPWRGNQTVSMFDVQRIECEPARLGSRHSRSVDIALYLKSGERRILLSSIQNRSSARFIRDQVWEFRNRSLHLDASPLLPSTSTGVYRGEEQVTGHSFLERSGNVLIAILLILMVISTFLIFRSFSSLKTSARMPSSGSYDRIEMWDFQADDTVRVTMLNTYPNAISKQSDWFSVPLVVKDADIASASPITGTLIEHRVRDLSYHNQTYRSHSYFMESDQRTFGYFVIFNTLPHLHVTGASSRLISIGLDPSNSTAQTSIVIAVILPDDVSGITVTDMKPYKTLKLNARTLYYYDARSVTAHQSIHIAYMLTGIPTTAINTEAILENSKP